MMVPATGPCVHGVVDDVCDKCTVERRLITAQDAENSPRNRRTAFRFSDIVRATMDLLEESRVDIRYTNDPRGIRALSLWQPWASLIADGRKTIETRPRPFHYVGPLAIHATMRVDRDACKQFGYDPDTIPRGVVVAVAQMNRCGRFTPTGECTGAYAYVVDAYGDFTAGRYGYFLSRILKLEEPVPAKGKQGIWFWPVPEAIITLHKGIK